MSSIRRLTLAIVCATLLTPLALLAAMPLLDPLWAIRPAIEFRFVLLLATLAFGSLIVTSVPVAVLTGWLRTPHSGKLAFLNGIIGLSASLPFFLMGGHVSPAPVIQGASIVIASLIVSITYLTTKERNSNG